MIFAINEEGDIEYDKRNKTFCTEIIGDRVETIKKKIKTILLTYLVHKDFFKYKFVLNKRNSYEDDEIEIKINNLLDDAFFINSELLNFLKFTFVNTGNKIDIIFYTEINKNKEIILTKIIEI